MFAPVLGPRPLARLLLALLVPATAFAACGDDETGAGGSGSGGDAATSASSAGTGTTTASSSGSGGGGSVTPPADPTEPWDLLSEWNLFVDGPAQAPADRVVPYQVIAELFSNEASKQRFAYVPAGATIGYEDVAAWRFPVGTVLVKTFAYPLDAREADGPLRLIETRLLWRIDGGWKALTYVWNDDGTDAERKSAGATVPVAWIDAEGASRELDYTVPNTNQCGECHDADEELETLGGWTLQLDRELDGENQIDRFATLGFFDGDPTPAEERVHLVDPFGDEDLALRGRSYLHANCASCHNPAGSASQQELFLDWASSSWASGDPEGDASAIGVCKSPTSPGGATCGNTFDIVPGDPDASVMTCRVASNDPEDRMPPLGRELVDGPGLALLEDFIQALPETDCGAGGSGTGGSGSGGGGDSGAGGGL